MIALVGVIIISLHIIAGIANMTGNTMRQVTGAGEEARGLGLADQLMEGILAEARNRGFEQIQLTVIASNPRAYKVYERWGFKLYGTEIQSVKVGDTYYDEQLRVCFLG